MVFYFIYFKKLTKDIILLENTNVEYNLRFSKYYKNINFLRYLNFEENHKKSFEKNSHYSCKSQSFTVLNILYCYLPG